MTSSDKMFSALVHGNFFVRCIMASQEGFALMEAVEGKKTKQKENGDSWENTLLAQMP
jgi:hypothetical protein